MGPYEIAAAIGSGGMGEVYRARDARLDRNVALKIVRGDSSPEQVERLEREARAVGSLNHPNIVAVYDVGTADGHAYVVSELLEGQTLRDRITGPLPVRKAVDYAGQIARGLAAAHEKGVVHRDVKPANLFVAEVGDKRTLKVLDFGIAKVLSSTASITTALEATKLGPTAFTPRYGAPEQFNKKRGASGPWTDVFALALIFVELVSGKKALDGDDPTELYIASADPTLRPTLRARGVAVPDAVEAVLHKALGVEPKQRYADAGEFWDALVAASGTTRGSQPSTPEVKPPGAQVAAARAAGPAELAATMPVESMAGVTAARGAAGNGDGPAAAPPSVAEDSMVETPISARGRLPSLRLGGDESIEPAVRSEVPGAPRAERAPAARAPLWPWLLGAAPFVAAAAWGISQLVPPTPT
jgi:serine/threonine protein kinase